jgi:hypothetical protein
MLPLPASPLPDSRHLQALLFLPTLPLWVLGVALTAKTVVRHVCDTLCNIPYARLQAICANTFFSSFSLMFVLGFQKRFKNPPVRCPRVGWMAADVEFVYSRRLRFATAILPKHPTESQYDRRKIKLNKRVIGYILGFGKEIGECGTRSRPVATASRRS